MWDSMMGWGWGWHGAGLFGIMHALWWVVIVVAIVALVRSVAGRGRSAHWPGPDRALEILRERYARGEIEKAEFEQRKRDLGG